MSRVVYTDPMWSIDPRTGQQDASAASLEREILGENVEVLLGLRRDGRFVLDGEDYHEMLRGADAVVVYRARADDGLLTAAGPQCRVIARQGVGTDNLDIPLLKSKSVYAFHVPDYCVDEVVVHTMALVLALERRVCIQNNKIRAGAWDIFAGGTPRRLSGLTLGVVGFGRIGRATAMRGRAFFGSVIAYDPYVSADLMAGYGAQQRARLQELMSDADVIVLHAALTVETRAIIDAKALDSIRPGTMLVNTARGGLVDTQAVLDALAAARLGGYGADVFTPEDPNDDPVNRCLLEQENVVVTAHRAFLSDAADTTLRRRVAEEVAHVLRTGEAPRMGRLA
jgi:phosphoglycerate dehydrogenase-like enzyme